MSGEYPPEMQERLALATTDDERQAIFTWYRCARCGRLDDGVISDGFGVCDPCHDELQGAGDGEGPPLPGSEWGVTGLALNRPEARRAGVDLGVALVHADLGQAADDGGVSLVP